MASKTLLLAFSISAFLSGLSLLFAAATAADPPHSTIAAVAQSLIIALVFVTALPPVVDQLTPTPSPTPSRIVQHRHSRRRTSASFLPLGAAVAARLLRLLPHAAAAALAQAAALAATALLLALLACLPH